MAILLLFRQPDEGGADFGQRSHHGLLGCDGLAAFLGGLAAFLGGLAAFFISLAAFLLEKVAEILAFFCDLETLLAAL